jgi:hypothetical protein
MVLLFLATRGTLRPALAPPSHLPVVHKRSQKRISSCFFFFRIGFLLMALLALFAPMVLLALLALIGCFKF